MIKSGVLEAPLSVETLLSMKFVKFLGGNEQLLELWLVPSLYSTRSE